MQLNGAIAVITGAGSGIGRALATELACQGATLVLVGRRADALEETRRQLSHPEGHLVVPLDVTEDGSATMLAQIVSERYGRLDLLVNNAGAVCAGALTEQDPAQWRAMFEVNVLAPMALTQALLPLLQASTQGRVVMIGSMFGDIAFPFFTAYSASKFAVRGFAEGARRELQQHGVAMTYCAPRGTKTPAADGFSRYVEAFAMALDPPEVVARHVVAGILRDARDVYPQGIERLFTLIQRVFPAVIDRALARQVQKAALMSGYRQEKRI